MRSRPSDSTDPLDRWEQRQQSSQSSSSRMSPRARELAAKNAARMSTAGRESSGRGLSAGNIGGLIFGTILLLPLTTSCGAVAGALITQSTAGAVVGAIVMVVLPIPFAIQRFHRKQEEKAAKARLAAEQMEIHQHNLRRARSEH